MTNLWIINDVAMSGRDGDRLSNISLQIPSGITAIMGPSGAGKSSLLNLLVEFEKPTSGSVINQLPNDVDQLPLFWVPQNAGLWAHLTVEEHLSAVCDDANHRRQLLTEFDLSSLASALPDTLSAGERGRLSVARAIASNAQVLVMDEPLANVDPIRANKYWRFIREHCKSRSLVFASHSVETVLREADSIVCMANGQIQYVGDKQPLYDAPETLELAELLGPANWFAQAKEADQWLENPRQDVRCYRPEHLKIEPAETSPIQVTAARYGSAIGELELFDQRSEASRTVFHRVNGRRFQSGDHIVLRVLSLMLMLACCVTFLPGCTGNVDPALPATEVNHWSIPPAGKMIPAPRSVRYAGDNEVFVLDNAGRVLVYSETGELLRQWHMPEYDVGKPEGICVMQDGRIAVTDTHYHRVVFFDREGNVQGMHGEYGRGPAQFVYPVAITQDPSENYYICEYGDNDRVQKFSVDGKLLLEFGGYGTDPGMFQRPSGVVWIDGRIYVADAINNRIQVFSDTGDFQQVLSHNDVMPKLHYPYDLITGRQGQLFVVEYGDGQVAELSLSGEVLSRWGGIGSAKGKLETPWGLAMSQNGTILVADTGNRRLVEIKR